MSDTSNLFSGMPDIDYGQFSQYLQDTAHYRMMERLDKYTGVELDEVAGHSWIIDGYVIATLDDESHNVHVKDFYVHNNMGWDGANNGYYLLTALSSSPMAYKESLLDLTWT